MPWLPLGDTAPVALVDRDMLTRVWNEMDCRLDVCRITKGGHTEHLWICKKTWRVSHSISVRTTMIRRVVYLLWIFEMFQGIMNNPVYMQSNKIHVFNEWVYSSCMLARHADSIGRSRGLRRRFCGRLLVGIMGSNTGECMLVWLLWMFCVARYTSLRRADHPSRGVLPSVEGEVSTMRPWYTKGCRFTGVGDRRHCAT